MNVRKVLGKIRLICKIYENKKVNELIAVIIFLKNFLLKKRELYVVGMPKSGSVFYHNVISDIVRQINHNICILNDANRGHQHLMYSPVLRLNKYRQVFGSYRDLRDVIVSTYFYVMDHHNIGPEILKKDAGHSTGEHPLYDSIKSLSFEKSINKLIFHENCLIRYNKWLLGYWNRLFVNLVAYEDIVSRDNQKIFQSLFKKIGIKISSEVIEKALNNNSFEEMHKKNPIHNKDGKIGKFMDFLNHEQIENIEKTYSEFFKLTGYKKISSASK